MKNKKKVIKKELYNLDYKPSPTKDCQKYIKSYNQKKFTKHIYTDSIVRGDYCSCLISILFNTNNIENTIYSIKQFLGKAHNPEKIQFCIKIDNDNKEFVKKFLKSLEKFECNFVILSSPRGRGYVDLWHWVNYLFKVSSKKSNFVMNTSDEMWVKEKNWDINLSKYVNLFDDGIFRLRTSVYKNRNYNTLWECGYAPDTTAIYSRKYLTIQGDFSPCFGPDNGQQFVAYYLSKLNYPRHYQYLRDYVVNDINFEGEGTNADMQGHSLRNRQVINYQLWNNMFTHDNQEDYYLRARKIQIAIISEFKNTDNKMLILHNHYNKNFTVFIKDINGENLKIILGYKINKYLHNLELLKKLDFFKHHTSAKTGYVLGVAVHFLMQHLNIHPETILYKENYGPFQIIKIVINEEHKVREVTFKNFIFIMILIFGSVYFYITNNQKRKKYKNFVEKQLGKLSKKSFTLNYFNLDKMKEKIPEFNNRRQKYGFTFVYTIINSFYEVFYRIISLPLSYISRNIYRILDNLSSKNKIFKPIYNLSKIIGNMLKYTLEFIDTLIFLLFNFVSYTVRIIFFQIPQYIIFNLFSLVYPILKLLYVNSIYRLYNISVITTKTKCSFIYKIGILKFIYFVMIAPYNIFIYLYNNSNFIYRLYLILYPKKINDIKYKKSSVVALSNKAQADQSKVIILKGDF